jgi:zinc protease
MKKTALASLPTGSLPGPHDITRSELPNGITLLVRPNFKTLSVAIAGYIQSGSIYEPEGKLGLADFVTTTLMRGTRGHSFQEIYDRLESMGASLGISAGAHTAGFGGKSLGEDLPDLLELLAESLREPVFPKTHVERVRSQLLTGLDLRSQDTSEMASLGFDQLAYAGHPYRFPSDGYPETISSITASDLAHFHHKHYGPGGMALAVVGPVEPEAVLAQVERLLGDWGNPTQPQIIEVPEVQPLGKTTTQHTMVDEKSQADIVLGVAGPRRSWGGYYPALIGNSVLGQFGMMGRIGEAVRIKGGLAYYAYSSLSSSIGPGPWTVTAGVDPANLEKAVELIVDEIRKFVSEPVSGEELADVKSSYIGKLPLSLESNSGVASALLNIERHNLGLDYYQRYEKMVREITAEAVLEAARTYLDPDRLAISTAGP